jgi:glycosyltransferase involved in cell wall biosynthesis
MNILFVTATYLPTVNGVSYHVKLLKQELEKRGHKVHVLAPNFPGYKDTEINIIRYFSIPNPYIKNYPIGLPLVSLDKIKRLHPDIIHTHHPLIVGKFASNLSEKINVPLIFTAHTQYEQYLNYYFPRGYQITSKILIKDLISLSKKCYKIICPSPDTEKRLNSHEIKNTQIIFNGINTNFFTPAKELFSDYPILTYTGRLGKEKNPLLLIKIASELKKISPNFRMIIIGKGLLVTKLSELIIKSKLENNVSLVGEINQELLPSIYKTVNIFITPSTSEVMPLSVLEAESSGLPVFALKKSGLECIVENNKSGYLLDPNPKTISKTIKELVKNRKKLKRFSKRSREISEKYSLEHCAKSVEQLYKKALHNQS